MTDYIAPSANAVNAVLPSGYTPPAVPLNVVLHKTIDDKPKRLMQGEMQTFYLASTPARGLSNCSRWQSLVVAIGRDGAVKQQAMLNIANPYFMGVLAFTPLANEIKAVYTPLYILSNVFKAYYRNLILLDNETRAKISDTVSYSACSRAVLSEVYGFNAETFEPLQPVTNFAGYISPKTHGGFVGDEHTSLVQEAIPVPCRYYAIPITPPKAVSVCDIRPPSSRLPLSLIRRRGGLLSSSLPLSLACWNDNSPKFIPNLRTYIVHNVITATIGGTAVDLAGFNIKTDTNSAYWQGSVEIPYSQYIKVKSKIEVERGNEPLVIVTINGFSFGFIAENISRNRQFSSHSYNIGGRSITARLGEDYAHAQGLSGGGVINQSLYASQIVLQQLADLPVTLENLKVQDWLIPANTYSVTGKTPISVIADIATACGGFVFSDPLAPKLSILPKWKTPAWEIATDTPDVVLNVDVTHSITDSTRANPRYNTVTLIGTEGSEVYRNLQGRERIAPIDSNALYTDRDCVVPRGIEILSDSGTHGDYTIKLRWADKYNIPLAKLGEIWQVTDPEGAWKGVINSVAVSVDWDNDTPCVWQTITIDRYLDA